MTARSNRLATLVIAAVGLTAACKGGWMPPELARFPGDEPIDPSKRPMEEPPAPEPQVDPTPTPPPAEPTPAPAPAPALTQDEIRIAMTPLMLAESEVPKGLKAPKELEVSLDESASSAIAGRSYFRNTQDKAIEALYDSRIIAPTAEIANTLIMDNWQGFLPAGMAEDKSAKLIGDSCRVFVGEEVSATGAKFSMVAYVFRVDTVVVFLLAVEGTNVKGSGLTPKVLLPYAEKALARVKKALE